MFAKVFASPTISISLEQDQILLHPLPAGFPTVDPVLRGTALVTLPSRRAIKNFKVTFEGACDAYGGAGFPYESTVTLSKSLETDYAGEVFEAGSHAFNFSFIVPSNTAVHQRSAFGRTRHWVKAHIEFDGGLLGSNLVSSAPTVIWLAANPTPPGELPTPTDISFQHYSEDLGPVGMSITSPHFTIAALCSVRLSLLGPPKPVTILAVNTIIEQTFEIHYVDGTIARPKPKKYVLAKVDSKASPSLTVAIHNPATCPVAPGPPSSSSSAVIALPKSLPLPLPSTCCDIQPDTPIADPFPLVQLQEGQEFHHSRVCRVPTDDFVRATTLESSDGNIRVSHRCSVEIRYTVEGKEEEMVLAMGKPLVVTSCCCLLDSLFLPTYSVKAPPKTILKPLKSRCACSFSIKDVMDRDGELLQHAGAIASPTSTPRILGIDGCEVNPLCKSPAWSDSGGHLPLLPGYGTPDSGFGGDGECARD